MVEDCNWYWIGCMMTPSIWIAGPNPFMSWAETLMGFLSCLSYAWRPRWLLRAPSWGCLFVRKSLVGCYVLLVGAFCLLFEFSLWEGWWGWSSHLFPCTQQQGPEGGGMSVVGLIKLLSQHLKSISNVSRKLAGHRLKVTMLSWVQVVWVSQNGKK